jgi:NAD(P)-dependent dehydrogenase (short-subunit alcohol dehydrogenase family)
MEVNYHAPADLMQEVIPLMGARGEGWIVNLTSSASRYAPGPPFHIGVEVGLYGASKAALNKLTNAMAASVYGTGIRINAVMPRAAVLSEGADALVGEMLKPGQVEPMESMVDSVLALCDCGTERTGQIYVSLDLLQDFTSSQR